MKIRNLTSETINILDKNNNVINTYPPENRIKYIVEYNIVDNWEGTPISRPVFNILGGLLKYEAGRYLIVPSEMKCLDLDLIDIITPSQPVLDKDGNLIGYRSLSL